ncbi:hypothetical protein [Streptomyces murinus]|uniref:hypothetical protein n=1 Tax=Streptomyces murinus TaxID=33900 RepID=UPI003800B96E
MTTTPHDDPVLRLLTLDLDRAADPGADRGRPLRPRRQAQEPISSLRPPIRDPSAAGMPPHALVDKAPAQRGAPTSAAELRAMREADLDRALARCARTGAAVRVARYSLVEPGQDPTVRLAQTQVVVCRRHWTTAIVTFDRTGDGDPALRPQLGRLVAALDTGEIHGIVALSRVDISPFDESYARTLAVLRARRGFLALARSETSI